MVISRYHRIAADDWIAIPLLGYLYAVDTLQTIPASADADSVAELRDAYRRAHFLTLIPSDADGHAPPGDWTQLVASAYDRKLYGFQIETSPQQDVAFIRWMNRRKNKGHFNLFVANCADFSRRYQAASRAADMWTMWAKGLLKSRKYVIPLALLTPPVAGGVAFLYLTVGRFSLKQNTAVFDIAREVHPRPARAEAPLKPATLTPVVASEAQDR